MLVSKNLLIYIDSLFKRIKDDAFVRLANKAGLEVEQITEQSLTHGLKIVKIMEINNHPNADRLHLVKIKFDKEEKTIVCGANNLEVGKYAIYAPIGTKIKDFTITKREIRGVESEGMLCGLEEITNINPDLLSTKDKSGIILLDNADDGDTFINKYLHMDDTIYDISIPSNRNDLNAILCLANELKYAYNQSFDLNRYLELDHRIGFVELKDKDKEFCNDVAFIKIENIKQFKPNWKEKAILLSSGYKINNNWLDLINLFVLYYGNPINIYDASKINLSKLSIKKIDNEKEFIANHKTYLTQEGMYGIYCDDKLINLMGLLVADEFNYHDETKDILIEFSNYNSSLINKYNDKLKVNNKNQQLLSKPLSNWITQNAFNEFAKYLIDKGYFLETKLSFELIVPKTIGYNVHDMYKFIGLNHSIEFNEVLAYDRYYVHPSRLDIKNEYDVYEEVLKIVDVDDLKPEPIKFEYQPTNYTEYNNLLKLKNYLIDYGFFETKTYNLSNQNDFNKFNLFELKNELKIINPISKAREYLRWNLIDEQLKVIKYNTSRKRTISNIFEIQNINTSLTKSHEVISILVPTNIIESKIAQTLLPKSFLTIKSLVTNMFKKINVTISFKENNKQNNKEGLFSAIQIIEANNQEVGYIFKLSNKVINEYDLQECGEIYGVCILLDDILNHEKTNLLKPVSNFPLVSRDINVEIDNEDKLNNIINKIKEVNNVISCNIKDYFIKEQKKIYTLNIIITDYEKTLSTQEIEAVMNKVNDVIGKVD